MASDKTRLAGKLSIGLVIVAMTMHGADSAHEAAFQNIVRPFLSQSCIVCHNAELKTAGLDLSVSGVPVATAERDVWARALKKIRSGEMPPVSFPRPPEESIAAATKWMEEQVARHDATHPVNPGTVTARRLNRAEYNNTIRDLLGVNLQPAEDFPIDDADHGFDNISDALSLSPILMEKYWKAVDQVVRAALEAPSPEKPTLRKFSVKNAGRPAVLPNDPDGVPLVVRNSFLYPFEVPAEAAYDINIILNGVGHPHLPPADLAILVSGKQVAYVKVEADEEGVYKKREFNVRERLTPGVHTIGAAFLKSSEDATRVFEGPGHEARHVLAVSAVEVRGPFDPAPAPLPKTFARLMTCQPAPGDWSPCARQILKPLAYRAWRRPVSSPEVDRLVEFVKVAEGRGDTFDDGIKAALKAVLLSPHFLFRIEQDSGNAQPIRALNGYEIASRLSYFLWSSMPDDTLLDLAAAGKLTDPAALTVQVRRMVADPKASALTENFAGQWLELRKLSSLSPDPKTFPEFDAELRLAMQKETDLFFEAVLRENRPVTDFIDGRYTFLNEKLAKHYGIQGVGWPGFRKVELDGVQRSGVMTQASILAISSYPTRTSPVLRGLWVLETMLGSAPPPPPPNIPTLEQAKVSADLPLRQRMEQHRADPRCSGCHAKMDAIGFGLENYDVIGAWRTQDHDVLLDTRGELPGNRPFSTPAELKEVLLAEKDLFAECLTEKLLTYALGRAVGRDDRPVIAGIAKKLAAKDYGLLTLVEEIVLSEPFRLRKVSVSAPPVTVAAAVKDETKK